MSHKLAEAVRFAEALGERPASELTRVELLHEPRGAQPAVRVGADAPRAAARAATSICRRTCRGSASARATSAARTSSSSAASRTRSASSSVRARRRTEVLACSSVLDPDRDAGQDRAHHAPRRRPRRGGAADAGRGRAAQRAAGPVGVRSDARQHGLRAGRAEDAGLRSHPPRARAHHRRPRPAADRSSAACTSS